MLAFGLVDTFRTYDSDAAARYALDRYAEGIDIPDDT
jgi:hypothetical protein